MIALTRDVSSRIADCELTHLARQPIDFDIAVDQHRNYEYALEKLGYRVRRLPPLPQHADSVFVEDTAIVLRELAIMTRPGAESRRGEVQSVADVLREYRNVFQIDAPGTIDGGDVLVSGATIYVGESTRTNQDAVTQLSALVTPCNYQVRRVRVSGCLHLKSAVTRVGDDTFLLNPRWVDASLFEGLRTIEVHPDEPAAANAVLTPAGVIYAGGFPQTRLRLEQAGINVFEVGMSELQKAEGAVTCCSILLD